MSSPAMPNLDPRLRTQPTSRDGLCRPPTAPGRRQLEYCSPYSWGRPSIARPWPTNVIRRMRIALNAQKLSFARAYQAGGISRYIFELLSQLRQISSAHRFEAFAPLVAPDTSLAPTEGFRLTPTGKATEHPLARILWEQIVLPSRAAGRFDLVHGLAFALPLAWRGRAAVTIFD